MQNRIDDLAKIAEAREDTTDYFRVMMVETAPWSTSTATFARFLAKEKGADSILRYQGFNLRPFVFRLKANLR